MGYVFLIPAKNAHTSLDHIQKEFEIDEIIFISSKGEKTDPIIKELKTENRTIPIQGDIWEEVFRIVQKTRKSVGIQNLIIGPIQGCEDIDIALINAGFANGLKILSSNNGKTTMLPLIKFSSYKELTDKKLEIVQLLYEAPDYELNLENIGTHTKMSPPLVSYHINGNIKSEGLKELGLIISRDDHGKSYVKLTKLGILIVKGYLDD